MTPNSHEQTDTQRISDMVSAAMETGNPAKARLVLAEHADTYPIETAYVRTSVLREYGVNL